MPTKKKQSKKKAAPAKKPATELAVIEPQQPTPQSMLLVAAATPGMSPETIGKFMDLQDRWEAKKAKKAFDEDMALLQAELPIIKKNKDGGKTAGGVVAYRYAPLDEIVRQTGPFIAKHGFSYRIMTGKRENFLFADCIVKHKLGHSETTPFEVPAGTGTNIMSAPQIQAATYTFAKRYAFCNAFGIMTGDEDTDARKGTNGETEPPAKEETMYDVAFRMISSTKSKKDLETYRARVNENPGFTNQQKVKLMGIINDKIARS